MKWKAHTRTAENVLGVFKALHFNKYEKELINGIIYPDNEDKEKNHYFGREQTIINNINLAREKRLLYDTRISFFHLGIAFHYIQDAWTGLQPGNDDHVKYLELINNCVLLDHNVLLEKYYPVRRMRVLKQFREIEKRLSKPVESVEALRDLAIMRKPFESCAFLDLNLSFRVCYRVAEMVLKTMYNIELQKTLEKIQAEYVERIKDREKNEIKSMEILEEQVGVLSLDASTLGKAKHWDQNRKLKKLIKEYERKNHLKPILNEFKVRVKELCCPHEKWYNIDKPTLDVKKILKPEAPKMSSENINKPENEVREEKIPGILFF
ncbi:hypothetical protein ACFL0D_04025 [Thermoproteota archaeon]